MVQARSFGAMLEQALTKYRNRAIETAAVIEDMIALAREMREAHQRGEALGMSEDEVAFYDALEVNDSAVKVLGDETLRMQWLVARRDALGDGRRPSPRPSRESTGRGREEAALVGGERP